MVSCVTYGMSSTYIVWQRSLLCSSAITVLLMCIPTVGLPVAQFVAAQLGHASIDHIPRELRIMGRTIQTQKGKAKWYDLPMTEQEIERGNAVGKET